VHCFGCVDTVEPNHSFVSHVKARFFFKKVLIRFISGMLIKNIKIEKKLHLGAARQRQRSGGSGPSGKNRTDSTAPRSALALDQDNIF
jgi:hypothetical protein